MRHGPDRVLRDRDATHGLTYVLPQTHFRRAAVDVREMPALNALLHRRIGHERLWGCPRRDNPGVHRIPQPCLTELQPAEMARHATSAHGRVLRAPIAAAFGPDKAVKQAHQNRLRPTEMMSSSPGFCDVVCDCP